ncbi:paraquat-inducible protein A [Oceanibium sediminis]|uniref:paraquat-inducible protein A n=1 Tax=Oceanibium sediminis TaxID=2026339 RepID=UPI000DD35DB1|nr:paraquat-inducible protein A [Oceanibium sediminis]
MTPARRELALRLLNLSLLVLFPLAWFAPLARAGLLPFFDLDEISVITGIQALWEEDLALALLVAFFAMIAPLLKTALLALIHWGALKPRALPLLGILSKLAMADVFLVAVYILLAKDVGVGRVEPAWGLWFFTACVLVSIFVTHLSKGPAR